MATTLSSNSVLFNSGVNQYIPAWSYNNLLVNGDMRVSTALLDTQRWAPSARYLTSQLPIVDGWFPAVQNVTTPAQGLLGPVAITPTGTDYNRAILYTNGTANSVNATTGYNIINSIVSSLRAGQYIKSGASGSVAMTLSFWVRVSITGTFAATVVRQSNNRTYSATFTVNTANTWEFKTISIPADTGGTGTFFTIRVVFVYGCGTNNQTTPNTWVTGFLYSNTAATAANSTFMATAGATYYVAGVTLEPGTTATPYSLATQPDFQSKQKIVKSQNTVICGGGSTGVPYNTQQLIGNAFLNSAGTQVNCYYPFGVPMDSYSYTTAADTTGLLFSGVSVAVNLTMVSATNFSFTLGNQNGILIAMIFPTSATSGTQGYLSRPANTIGVISLSVN